jgi:coenzyme Q-binding protein COQ10
MHRFDDSRVLPYTPRQLFDLVADIARYPEFLPWCLGARIGAREAAPGGTEVVMADLIVGARIFRETFTSRVTLAPDAEPPRIDVDYVKGPMKKMENHWAFIAEGSATRLEFHVAFEFRSALLEKMMGAFFDDAQRRMIAAFEARALRLYGPGAGA